MTIAGHDLVLTVTALTLPDRRPDAPQRTIRTHAVSNRPNVAILAAWLNITADREPTRLSTYEESRHDGNNTPNRS